MSKEKNENDQILNEVKNPISKKSSDIIKIKRTQTKELTKSEIREVAILTRGKRYMVFTMMFLMNITINMDNGTVPALIDQIALELDLPKEIIGLFGSLQYGGNLVGNKF